MRGTERVGFEINRTASPSMTRPLRFALETLSLDRAFVVHGGDSSFPLDARVTAVAARDLLGRSDL